jgi:hypothetical protein
MTHDDARALALRCKLTLLDAELDYRGRPLLWVAETVRVETMISHLRAAGYDVRMTTNEPGRAGVGLVIAEMTP